MLMEPFNIYEAEAAADAAEVVEDGVPVAVWTTTGAVHVVSSQLTKNVLLVGHALIGTQQRQPAAASADVPVTSVHEYWTSAVYTETATGLCYAAAGITL